MKPQAATANHSNMTSIQQFSKARTHTCRRIHTSDAQHTIIKHCDWDNNNKRLECIMWRVCVHVCMCLKGHQQRSVSMLLTKMCSIIVPAHTFVHPFSYWKIHTKCPVVTWSHHLFLHKLLMCIFSLYIYLDRCRTRETERAR